jgi:hypothetical protein
MHRWTDRNLTLLELSAALLLIALFIGIFARHMLIIFARAESTLVNATVININSSLNYHAMFAVINKDTEKLSALESMNAMSMVRAPLTETGTSEHGFNEFLNQQFHNWMPGNYIGELEAPDPDLIPGGKWYFDVPENTLVYRVNNPEYFYSELEGPPRIRFQARVEYKDVNADGIFDPAIDKFQAVKLESLEQYEWRF